VTDKPNIENNHELTIPDLLRRCVQRAGPKADRQELRDLLVCYALMLQQREQTGDHDIAELIQPTPVIERNHPDIAKMVDTAMAVRR
jgi:hypothetical protein